MSQTLPYRQLVTWLEAKRPEFPVIDLDLDLIEHRIVDSLELMDFILMIEQLCGREIELEAVELDTFRTLRSIHDAFFLQPEVA